ncbi:MAG: hypothetical protein IPN38_04035 [Flavobacteriales bacterium]|nr:hypothetical protein [Flavobacteriales bacterium]
MLTLRLLLLTTLVTWFERSARRCPGLNQLRPYCSDVLNTPPETWATLKLTPDQLRRMLLVQDACREECEATGAKKSEDSISNADGSTILSEVKNILSEEQYAAWVATCTPALVLQRPA